MKFGLFGGARLGPTNPLGESDNYKDLVTYVKDAVEMTIHLAESQRAGGLYNLGSGEANSWNTLARAIFSALDREPRIEYIPMPEILRAKYQYFTQAEIGKLRETGYDRPITPLADSVADYVRNYLVPESFLGDEALSGSGRSI